MVRASARSPTCQSPVAAELTASRRPSRSRRSGAGRSPRPSASGRCCPCRRSRCGRPAARRRARSKLMLPLSRRVRLLHSPVSGCGAHRSARTRRRGGRGRGSPIPWSHDLADSTSPARLALAPALERQIALLAPIARGLQPRSCTRRSRRADWHGPAAQCVRRLETRLRARVARAEDAVAATLQSSRLALAAARWLTRDRADPPPSRALATAGRPGARADRCWVEPGRARRPVVVATDALLAHDRARCTAASRDCASTRRALDRVRRARWRGAARARRRRPPRRGARAARRELDAARARRARPQTS